MQISEVKPEAVMETVRSLNNQGFEPKEPEFAWMADVHADPRYQILLSQLASRCLQDDPNAAVLTLSTASVLVLMGLRLGWELRDRQDFMEFMERQMREA